jgi:hypothetical protein
MEIETKISEIHHPRKIIVLKDELGNIATGRTYNEALDYLTLRRKNKTRIVDKD